MEKERTFLPSLSVPVPERHRYCPQEVSLPAPPSTGLSCSLVQAGMLEGSWLEEGRSPGLEGMPKAGCAKLRLAGLNGGLDPCADPWFCRTSWSALVK